MHQETLVCAVVLVLDGKGAKEAGTMSPWSISFVFLCNENKQMKNTFNGESNTTDASH